MLTPEKVEALWTQLQEFPIVFDDFHNGKGEFEQQLLDRRSVFIDIGPGKGLAVGNGVRPGMDMLVHLVMFDRRLRGREPLFREIMDYFFRSLRLRRMTASIAEDAGFARSLAKRLGFQPEGKLRQAMKRGGKFLDVYLYGLLAEEFYAAKAA